MRILRHFTANDEKISSFPFKRELSMEAYLIENESTLCLDNLIFSDVEIIQEELTLKQGRKSKNTDGRIDILATYSQEYIAIIELKLGQLENIHLEQLEDYLLQKHQIVDEFHELLGAELIESPKWIGVLVGSSINPELANKIQKGYISNSGVQIAALTVQRFKSESGNVYVTTDTYFKDITSKDITKYKYLGKSYGKGRLVLEVVKQYVENNPDIKYDELESIFPKKCQGSYGVFSTCVVADEIYTRTNRWRHFFKPEEHIKLANETIVVCSQWGSSNIDKFLSQARNLGFKVE